MSFYKQLYKASQKETVTFTHRARGDSLFAISRKLSTNFDHEYPNHDRRHPNERLPIHIRAFVTPFVDGYGVRAQRKPLSLSTFDGISQNRLEVRANSSMYLNEPPRITLKSPESGPGGLDVGEL